MKLMEYNPDVTLKDSIGRLVKYGLWVADGSKRVFCLRLIPFCIPLPYAKPVQELFFFNFQHCVRDRLLMPAAF